MKGILMYYWALCFTFNVFIKFMHHLTRNFEQNIIVKVSSMQWNDYEIKQKVSTLDKVHVFLSFKYQDWKLDNIYS